MICCLLQDKRYVCVKMYGGGMGDQIKRYCEKMEPEVGCGDRIERAVSIVLSVGV